MIATLTNTSTLEAIALQYLPLQIDGGGVDASFAAVAIPGSTGETYWQGSSRAGRSLSFTLTGTTAKDRLKQLEKWAIAAPPAEVILQIGAMPPERAYLASVRSRLPLAQFAGQVPTRIEVSISLNTL